MTRPRSILKSILLAEIITASAFSLLGCSPTGTVGVPKHLHKYRITGSTYVDESYNCQISIPNANWNMEAVYDDFGDGRFILSLFRSVYNTAVFVAVSDHRQESLEVLAGKGTYNPKLARFTYIAGNPCFFATKPMKKQGIEMTTVAYKLVNNNIGYIISIAYATMWSQDEGLQTELDDILNSFEFLTKDEELVASAEAAGSRRGRLSNVAILDLVDLEIGKPSQTTKGLTSQLQDQCANSGRFELLERRGLDKILQEQDLQLSGMLSGQSAIKAGQLLGARYLISGNVGRIGQTWVLYVQISDAETGKIIATASVRRKKSTADKLLDTMPLLVKKLISRM